MAERLLVLEDGVELWKIPIDEIHEQDVNARVMDMSAFRRLTENIKERGALVESLPYCHMSVDGRVTIVSGHHRVRAARAAGVRELHILVDTSALSRSSVVSKQLAHNAIAGHDDTEMLKQLLAEISNVEDLLRSYVAPELLPASPDPLRVTSAAAVDFEFRTMMFTFLPSSFQDFQRLIDLIPGKQDFIGIADVEQFPKFRDALHRYQKAVEIKSVGAAISYLTDVALRETELQLELTPEEDDVWVSLATIFDTTKIPYSVATLLRQVIMNMEQEGAISDRNSWQVLEYLAAEYLAALRIPA